eukprot:scaffold125221_cov75-Phaeocystis_antarctica.AAC.1
MSSDAVRKSERVTDGSAQNEIKTAASRLRSAALRSDPLRAASRTVSTSATASISTSGHNPLKARRVISPPTHFQSGKIKLPKSKPRGSRTDSQSLSPLGKAWHAEQGKAQQSEKYDDRQKHGELLESIALHVAAPFAGGRSGVVVAIGMGAHLAAWPLVAGGALGAVQATEARGYVA